MKSARFYRRKFFSRYKKKQKKNQLNYHRNAVFQIVWTGYGVGEKKLPLFSILCDCHIETEYGWLCVPQTIQLSLHANTTSASARIPLKWRVYGAQ